MKLFLLPRLLTEAALRFPDRRAVVDARGELNYAELDRRANRVANLLRQTGVSRGSRVGLYLNKSVDAIVGIYGILKAEAAYVPLDPFAPPSRLAYIIRNCGIRHLVTGCEKASSWTGLLESETTIETMVVVNTGILEAPPPPGVRYVEWREVGRADDSPPVLSLIDQDLAYILYTSGSTGQPKGVMISHLNALSFIRWCRDYFQPTENDVFSNHAPLHFDLTILDIYVAALAGATLVIVPPEASVFPVQLADFVRRHAISIWYSVPSVLTMLALHGNLTPGALPSLRHVVFAGEVFPTKHLRNLMRVLPRAQFTNLYGPTETNVCTYYRVPPLSEDQTEPIPIGRAIDNVEVLAVSESGARVGPGEVGELWVRGPTVAYGYWGDPEKTARGFLTNPFGPGQDRMYRTGDLVRQDSNGDYVFLGRRDHQIKSRGYRIEIGDIEAAIHAHPDIAECAVIPVPDEVVGNRIKAVVVSGNSGLTDVDLASFIATKLPKYMIPEQFDFVAALPKTSTGKVDRQALTPTGARG